MEPVYLLGHLSAKYYVVMFCLFCCTQSATLPYRDDYQCGGGWLAPNGEVAQCDPEGIYPCCSPYNWCGITSDHCDCEDCIDYRDTGKYNNYQQLSNCFYVNCVLILSTKQ